MTIGGANGPANGDGTEPPYDVAGQIVPDGKEGHAVHIPATKMPSIAEIFPAKNTASDKRVIANNLANAWVNIVQAAQAEGYDFISGNVGSPNSDDFSNISTISLDGAGGIVVRAQIYPEGNTGNINVHIATLEKENSILLPVGDITPEAIKNMLASYAAPGNSVNAGTVKPGLFDRRTTSNNLAAAWINVVKTARAEGYNFKSGRLSADDNFKDFSEVSMIRLESASGNPVKIYMYAVRDTGKINVIIRGLTSKDQAVLPAGGVTPDVIKGMLSNAMAGPLASQSGYAAQQNARQDEDNMAPSVG